MAFWNRKAKTEDRQGYTDYVTAGLYAHAEGRALSALNTGVQEVAAGLWSRSFSLASVSGLTLDPPLLAMIGRELCTKGQFVGITEVRNGMPILVPVTGWTVRGKTPFEDEWEWEVLVSGPDGQATVKRPGTGVVNVRYASRPESPWIGYGPLQGADTTAKMIGNIDLRLSQEAGSTVAYVIPMPTDPNHGLDGMSKDLAGAKGEKVLVESLQNNYGEGGPQGQEWHQRRLGPDPSKGALDLKHQASVDALAACGIPPALVSGEGAAASAARELWRQFLHGTLQPLGHLVAVELSKRFEVPVELDFSRLMASDLQGRARAYQSMVGAGMDAETAMRLTGFDQ